MARYEGTASIRRALSMPDRTALLDIRPEGSQWRWAAVPVAGAHAALACGIAAISGGWKLYISLPDDPTSNALEVVGLTNTRDRPDAGGSPAAMVLHMAISPPPRGGISLTFTVKVTDGSATPVAQAAVSLHNFTAGGADEMHTQSTLADGSATFPNITLNSLRVTETINENGRNRTTTLVTFPSLTASKDGYDTVTMNLL
jgi:hypothetical protein